MTAVWQPGTTYIPGSIVRPTATVAPGQTPLTNPDFETGDLTGWTSAGAPAWNNGSGGYTGSFMATARGGGIGEIKNAGISPVSPGQTITAQAMARLTNAGGTDDLGAEVALYWLDGSGTFISQTEGAALTGVGGSWHPISVSGVAPANAAQVQFVLGANTGSHGGNIDFDSCSWNSSYNGPPAGLLYKATQAAPGKSGATEPAWPGNTTTPVTDNQVTWQGVIATQLVWTASPINRSGATEPTWPLVPGAAVDDNGIVWIAKSRAVDDPNCPHSKIVAIAASKVYAADDDIIRYSATVNPLDWTSTNDAGYLPFGLQTFGSNPAAAMNLYRSNLAIFNAEGFQMWQVDEDPANTALLDALPIASTQNLAMCPVANDLLFLSSQGVRSMGIAATGVNLQASDVGMPIDDLVYPAMQAALASGSRMLATFIPALGQYWLAVPNYPAANLQLVGNLPDMPLYGTLAPFQYVASGDFPPFTLSIGGALPPGLTMDASGNVTGSPTQAGTFNWLVNVVDQQGNTLSLPDTCNVTTLVDPNTVLSRYLLITTSDTIDRSAVGFDDSSWPTGYMPLANQPRPDAAAAGFPLNYGVFWPLTNNAWFRMHLNLVAPQNIHLRIYLDDAAQVFVNGVSVFNQNVGGGVPHYLWDAVIPASAWVAGDNVIAVKCRGDLFGVSNYVSFRMAASP
jgi:hypothetical protein